MESIKEYEEKPIFEVKRHSVISVFIGLLLILGISMPLMFLVLFPAILSIAGIISISIQSSGFSILFLGACNLLSIYVLIDILSFKKIAIYEDYVLIKRNFLARDTKIKISDIEFICGYGMFSCSTMFLTNNKNFLRLNKSFSVYALYDEDIFEIREIVRKIKEKKGV
ncbi:MAG: hypothetical protein LBG67_01870 [Campylobacteraceae bacterium]|jgi:hypothetical protein|nr:hypothetical protein [Campylobacteraceae bacterium]